MKKTAIAMLILAASVSLAGCGSQTAETTAEEETAEAAAEEETAETAAEEETAEAAAEEETAEVAAEDETAEAAAEDEEDSYLTVDWDRDLFADLDEVISGVEDMEFVAGEATRADIREPLQYDEDLVRLVMIDTDNVSLVNPGTYEMSYNICFNREPLLEWMEENGIDSSLYPGMDSDAGRLFVTTMATVTVE